MQFGAVISLAPLNSAPLTLILKKWILVKLFCSVVECFEALARTIRWMHWPSQVDCNVILPVGTTLTCPMDVIPISARLDCWVFVFWFCFSFFSLLLVLSSAPNYICQHLFVFRPGVAKEKLTVHLRQFSLIRFWWNLNLSFLLCRFFISFHPAPLLLPSTSYSILHSSSCSTWLLSVQNWRERPGF